MARKGTHHRNGEQVVIVLGAGVSGDASVGGLAKTINEELMQVGVAVSDEMQAVFDDVGKEAAQKLRETSPINPKGKQSGRYAKGWVYEAGKTTYNNQNKIKGVVRNKTDPQLTHILEYGHPLIRDGKKVGEVDPQTHIEPVAVWVAEELNKRLNNLLGG